MPEHVQIATVVTSLSVFVAAWMPLIVAVYQRKTFSETRIAPNMAFSSRSFFSALFVGNWPGLLCFMVAVSSLMVVYYYNPVVNSRTLILIGALFLNAATALAAISTDLRRRWSRWEFHGGPAALAAAIASELAARKERDKRTE